MMNLTPSQKLTRDICLAAGMLVLHLLAVLPVPAQEIAETRPLKDQAEVAVINTSGNTDVLTLSLKNTLAYAFNDALTVKWELYALYGEQAGAKSAERYSTDLRGDYALDAQNYLYASSGWLRDEFAGLKNRYYGGPGMGHKILNNPKHLLEAELGANLTREEYTARNSANFLEGRAYVRYAYAVSERSRFLQSLEYLQDLEDSANYKMVLQTPGL